MVGVMEDGGTKLYPPVEVVADGTRLGKCFTRYSRQDLLLATFLILKAKPPEISVA
jgi:hypothetical protein